MKRFRLGVVVGAIALLAGGSSIGCRRAIVIVPQPSRNYTATDTLYGRLKGDEVRVTFRHVTVSRVDTVTRLDTIWRAGARTVVRVDTLVRTRLGARTDTLRLTVRDTIRIVVRDTVVRTVTVARPDTIRIATRDTVFRTDTIRLAGRRHVFVPPGQYPPAGQCRVWIHDLPPGRQAPAAPCDELRAIPAGAFILFGGEAWDFDYDWVAEATRGRVPPEIVAVKRRGGG